MPDPDENRAPEEQGESGERRDFLREIVRQDLNRAA
jgi:hypothetical protein